jgi:hypothetical protein
MMNDLPLGSFEDLADYQVVGDLDQNACLAWIF